MPDNNVETRVDLLELQMSEVLQRLGKSPSSRNWRQTIGTLADQPEMQAIFDAAETEREQDRQAFYAEFDQRASS